MRLEHASSPNKPIYLVGDSFGGCLALAVAARNPNIDLVLILANPGQFCDMEFYYYQVYVLDTTIHTDMLSLSILATSFGRSQLQPLFPILEALPDELHVTVPYLLSSIMGNDLCYTCDISCHMLQFAVVLVTSHEKLKIFSDISSFSTSGEPTKMAMVNIDNKLPPRLRSQQFSANLSALLPRLSVRNACSCSCVM